MKGVVYNLNSMHSRAGAQIPFSSLNIGVPFSKEAAIICQLFLEEFEKGLGFGETPIFPNVIFRLIDGINKKPQDPYYDLFKLACRVSSTRMNPTFLNCNAGGLSRFTKRILKDAKLDKDGKLLNEPKSKEIDYAKCIKYMEQGTDLLPVRMGCRTSVLANINGFETGSGRGNIAPCTINLPRLSIFVFEEKNKEKRVQKFFEEFDKSINLAKDNLVHRFNVLSNLKVKDIPFNIGQAELLGSEEIMYDKFSSIKSVLKQGSFAIGYVGMAECLKGLLGKHHGEDEESEEMAIQILQHLTKRCEEFKQQYQLNFSVYATPAESVASRVFYTDIAEFGEEKFTKIFGKENAEKGFYTNSSHIPVDFKISYVDKIKKEAPLHRLSPAGAIFYLEFDSTPSVETTMKIVSYIATTDIEYYGLNYSIVYCPHCLQRMALGELTKEEYNKMHKKHACSKC
jgi:ribonucleoside-triphosphate reductase